MKVTSHAEHKRSKYNSKEWAIGTDEAKERVRGRKRRLHFVSQVLVLKDTGNPDNEGRTFKFKFGKKIHDKIMDLMQPQFEDETPVDPFDFWGGADFKLKIRNVEGYRNYDKSEFDKPSELFDGDEDRLKELYESLESLADIVSPDKFKTYAELSAKLKQVLGEDEVATQYSTAERLELEDTVPAPKQKAAAAKSPAPSTEDSSDDDGGGDSASDTLGYFARLAKGE